MAQAFIRVGGFAFCRDIMARELLGEDRANGPPRADERSMQWAAAWRTADVAWQARADRADGEPWLAGPWPPEDHCNRPLPPETRGFALVGEPRVTGFVFATRALLSPGEWAGKSPTEQQ